MNKKNSPDYIFEISWEVCNKVGGIYTVLSSKADYLVKQFPNTFFLGPDLGKSSDIYFEEEVVYPTYRVGTWNIKGHPKTILVRWNHLYPIKNDIYGQVWQRFGVESHAAYGDYDDSALFSYAAGQIVQQFCIDNNLTNAAIIAHANEWQTAFFIFYLQMHCPFIATVFTTHATSIGRSIAGNNKPLYDYFTHYNGDQMAHELNMVSKHSAEKHAALYTHCFTTVSQITSEECKQLLTKQPDIITPNGFDNNPYTALTQKEHIFTIQHSIKTLTTNITGKKLERQPIFICTSGRFEFHNKGYDVFLDTLNLVNNMLVKDHCDEQIIALVLVPFFHHTPIVLSNVTILFIPYYLDGHSIPDDSPYSPLASLSYYELLASMDISIYPSYYEPWGYTPQESCSLAVPTITTSLSGFGRWVTAFLHKNNPTIQDGVGVIERHDSNTAQVVQQIAEQVCQYVSTSPSNRKTMKKKTADIGKNTTWKAFFHFYSEAYQIALQKNITKKY